MDVNRFIGKYAEAEDANNYIDRITIEKNVEKIRKEIENLEGVKQKLDTSSDNFRKEHLSFFGKDMEEDIEKMREKIDENIQRLQEYIEALLFETDEAIYKKQAELNRVAEDKEEKEEERIKEEERQKQEEKETKEKDNKEDIEKIDKEINEIKEEKELKGE